MSYNRQQFLVDVEILLACEEDEQYEKFLCIVKNYENINQIQLKSIGEFDKIHSNLLNMLLQNNKDNGPLIDYSQYQKFDLIMKSLRQIVEKLVIENCIAFEKIDQLEMKVDELSEETNNLQKLIYEKEFKKLLSFISTLLKNKLRKEFRRYGIRMDPLDEDLLQALSSGTYITGISNQKMQNITSIFQKIASEIRIYTKQLIEIIRLRLERNIEQHDLFTQYMKECKNLRTEVGFIGLINHFNLNGLFKYKETELKVLKKVFEHYVNEYR